MGRGVASAGNIAALGRSGGRLTASTAVRQKDPLSMDVSDMAAFQAVMEGEAGAEAMQYDGVRRDTIAIHVEASPARSMVRLTGMGGPNGPMALRRDNGPSKHADRRGSLAPAHR